MWNKENGISYPIIAQMNYFAKLFYHSAIYFVWVDLFVVTWFRFVCAPTHLPQNCHVTLLSFVVIYGMMCAKWFEHKKVAGLSASTIFCDDGVQLGCKFKSLM